VLLWNGSAWVPGIPPAAGVAGAVPAPGPTTYPSIPAGTPVAQSGDALVAADAGDPVKMPCIGFYQGAATNLVKSSGTIDGLSGITVDALYYVAVGGGLTTTEPVNPTEIVQLVGKGATTTSLYALLGTPVTNASPPTRAGGRPGVERNPHVRFRKQDRRPSGRQADQDRAGRQP
jgi:hypothetical protein